MKSSTLSRSTWPTIRKLTRWVRSTNPSTFERGRARARRTARFQNHTQQHACTLETTLGQMAPPKSGHPLSMPPESGGIPGRVHFWEVPFALMLSPGRFPCTTPVPRQSPDSWGVPYRHPNPRESVGAFGVLYRHPTPPVVCSQVESMTPCVLVGRAESLNRCLVRRWCRLSSSRLARFAVRIRPHRGEQEPP